MTKQELRVGNLYRHVKAGEITLEDEWISYFCKFPELLEGIPLTSELLLRFGFKVHHEDRTSIEYWIGHNPVTRDYLFMVCEIKGGPEVEIFYRNGFHRIRFVHQLMNLYYALTGTELTLK